MATFDFNHRMHTTGALTDVVTIPGRKQFYTCSNESENTVYGKDLTKEYYQYVSMGKK